MVFFLIIATLPSGGGGGGGLPMTAYTRGHHRERVTFFRLQVYERVADFTC